MATLRRRTPEQTWAQDMRVLARSFDHSARKKKTGEWPGSAARDRGCARLLRKLARYVELERKEVT